MADYLLTFPSTYTALKAEEYLRRDGLPFRLLPTPSGLVRGCGLSIGFGEGVRDRVLQVLKERRIRFRCYMKKDGDYEPINPY